VASAVSAERRPYLDHGDFISVNLFRGKQRPIADTDCLANFSMGAVEPLQDLGLVM